LTFIAFLPLKTFFFLFNNGGNQVENEKKTQKMPRRKSVVTQLNEAEMQLQQLRQVQARQEQEIARLKSERDRMREETVGLQRAWLQSQSELEHRRQSSLANAAQLTTAKPMDSDDNDDNDDDNDYYEDENEFRVPFLPKRTLLRSIPLTSALSMLPQLDDEQIREMLLARPELERLFTNDFISQSLANNVSIDDIIRILQAVAEVYPEKKLSFSALYKVASPNIAYEILFNGLRVRTKRLWSIDPSIRAYANFLGYAIAHHSIPRTNDEVANANLEQKREMIRAEA
jgi:hypothetical protein